MQFYGQFKEDDVIESFQLCFSSELTTGNRFIRFTNGPFQCDFTDSLSKYNLFELIRLNLSRASDKRSLVPINELPVIATTSFYCHNTVMQNRRGRSVLHIIT